MRSPCGVHILARGIKRCELCRGVQAAIKDEAAERLGQATSPQERQRALWRAQQKAARERAKLR